MTFTPFLVPSRCQRLLGHSPWGRKTIITTMAAPKKSILYCMKSRSSSGRTIMTVLLTMTMNPMPPKSRW